MFRVSQAGILAATILCMLGGTPAAAANGHCIAKVRPPCTLTPFRSEHDLRAYLEHLPKTPPPPPPPPPPSPPPPPPPGQAAPAATTVGTTSITNNQVIGVDEGDIVKQQGDTLVVLRRGRLFTVSLAGGVLKSVDMINAYPPGVNAADDWYDEMLLADGHVIVIGYSYARGGMQIDRFRLDKAGHLAFEDAYQVNGSDYYSSRNYASRLIGTTLVLYAPTYAPYTGSDESMFSMLPGLRKWSGSGKAPGFERVGSALHVYMAPNLRDDMVSALYTVMTCDVAAPQMGCRATSVFGPSGSTHFVSSTAMYLWLSPYWGENGPGKRASSLLYRIPLDGSAPTAIGVHGSPVDQFSFDEDARGGVLNVVVRANSAGDAMWTSEFANGATGLLRLPLADMADGMAEAPRVAYRNLPMPKGDYWSFHNRFIGDYLLYGIGNGWSVPADASSVLTVAGVRTGSLTRITLPHGVDRIEAMGSDAVIVGSDTKNVYFSAVTLGGAAPASEGGYVMTGAAQSETRSHGFFFRPDATDPNAGVLGLPITRPATPGAAQLAGDASAVTFVRRAGASFTPLGELASAPLRTVDDACVASCTDWYGNARPIFLGDRTFALMGYEVVEGTLSPAAIRERGRVNFTPPGRAAK